MNFLGKLLVKYSSINKAFLFILAIVLIVLQFPHQGKFKYELQKGKPWMHEDLIAPFDFAINKTSEQINAEKQTVLSESSLYYTFYSSIGEEKKALLKTDFEKKWEDKYDKASEGKKNATLKLAERVLDSIYSKGIIALDDSIASKSGDFSIHVMQGNVAVEKQIDDYYTIRSASDYVKNVVKARTDVDQAFIEPIIENALAQNIKYNQDITTKYRQDMIDNISLTTGLIQKGERVVSKGELITPEKYQVINSLKQEYEAKVGNSSDYFKYLLGQIMLICISIVVLVLFMWSFRKEIFDDNRKVFMILLVIYMMVFVTSMVIKINFSYLYIIPLCIAPIIIRAFFDTRLALFVHIVTIIIIGFLAPNSFEFMLLQLIAGIIAIISVVNMRKRSQFFLTSLLVFATYSATYLGMTLMQEGTLENTDPQIFIIFAGGSALVLLSYPLIFVFERIFGFTTDVSLMELSDFNSKLLRELSLKAPATFQHSLQVANLAEEAIYEIGGNTLLIRTGALYHDIGKMDMPMYFTENQFTELNPHDELAAEESAAIIISHVTKGIEIAKKYNIPDKIIDFIRTHHGTKKTLYFYNQFIKNNPDQEVDESIFTYHGPIPFSKETAVMMMADAIEAVSRSMKKPDEKSISEMIDRIIDSIIEQKQFSNADITLKEISIIKKIFKKRMLNMMHVRIEYPV
jgi:cyclic-di-AMP phosphodiesterase PgpH